jgi:hypothetical protein
MNGINGAEWPVRQNSKGSFRKIEKEIATIRRPGNEGHELARKHVSRFRLKFSSVPGELVQDFFRLF